MCNKNVVSILIYWFNNPPKWSGRYVSLIQMFHAIHSTRLLHSPIQSPVPPPCAWLLSAASVECSLPWRSHSVATQLPPAPAARNSLPNIAAHPQYQLNLTVHVLDTCLLLPVCNSCRTASTSDNASDVTAGIDFSTSLHNHIISLTQHSQAHADSSFCFNSWHWFLYESIWFCWLSQLESWSCCHTHQTMRAANFTWEINTFSVNPLCSPLDLRVSFSALAFTCSN